MPVYFTSPFIVNDKSIYTFARLLRRICVAKQHIHLQIRAHPAGGFIVKDKTLLSFTINLSTDQAIEERMDTECSAVLMRPGNFPVGWITLMREGTDLIITDLEAGSYGYAGVGTLFSHLYSCLKVKREKDFYIGFIGADDAKLKPVSEVAGEMIDFEKGETIVHGVITI